MEILEINDLTEERKIELFLAVAKEVYKDDPIWVPESEQAFMQRLKSWKTSGSVKMRPLVALEDNHPVARGAVILAPQALDDNGNPQGWIGFFEALQENQDAAETILHKCEDILSIAGAKSILTPKVDNLLVGLLMNGFTMPHTVLTNYNPPYYSDIFHRSGYDVDSTLHTFNFMRATVNRAEVKLPGFITREFDKNQLPREIKIFNQLQNSIFTGANRYIPRTFSEDQELVQSFLPFLDEELVIIAEDEKGQAVGLLICLPDFYQALKGSKIDHARIISVGVKTDWKKKGVGAMMGSHLMRNLIIKGYQTAEASLVLDRNIPPHNLVKRFNATSGKEYALFRKKLQSKARC
jgi:GNAT superfamily N-acetyltransferase